MFQSSSDVTVWSIWVLEMVYPWRMCQTSSVLHQLPGVSAWRPLKAGTQNASRWKMHISRSIVYRNSVKSRPERWILQSTHPTRRLKSQLRGAIRRIYFEITSSKYLRLKQIFQGEYVANRHGLRSILAIFDAVTSPMPWGSPQKYLKCSRRKKGY